MIGASNVRDSHEGGNPGLGRTEDGTPAFEGMTPRSAGASFALVDGFHIGNRCWTLSAIGAVGAAGGEHESAPNP
jgi:hypothetical protein